MLHILLIFYKENRHIKFLFSEAHPSSLLKANRGQKIIMFTQGEFCKHSKDILHTILANFKNYSHHLQSYVATLFTF